MLLPAHLFAAANLAKLTTTSEQELITVTLKEFTIPEDVRLALQEGTPVSFTWSVSIEQVNPYWINEPIGEIIVTREVIPNLISKSWMLIDSATGSITRNTSSLNTALNFLTPLNNFPLLDRALLSESEHYALNCKLLIFKGERDESWWSAYFHFAKTVAQGSFQQP